MKRKKILRRKRGGRGRKREKKEGARKIGKERKR